MAREAELIVTTTPDGSFWQRLRVPVILVLIAGGGWLVRILANTPELAASTDVGYYIGVVGASLMLLLMTYPLYKRFRLLRGIGTTRFWFRLHMICGLAGPILIIVHSGLQTRSMNAAWAFWSMIVVALSGIVGRFLYRGLHRGMHGELETAQSLAAAVAAASYNIDRAVSDDADISRRVGNYATRCAALAKLAPVAAVGSFILPFWRWSIMQRVRRSLARSDIPADRQAEKKKLLGTFLLANQRYAQFALFDRLFSFWHVAHVPFVVTLFLATIAHIVAVHLY